MTKSIEHTGILGQSDTWIGVALIACGGTAAMMAAGFDAISRSYPLTLAILLVLFGAGLVARVAVSNPKHVFFAMPAKVAALSGLVIVLWIAALTIGLGFILPTFLMQAAFLVLCGVRPVRKAAIYAAMITGGGYLAFVLGLGVRLPEALAPWIL